MSGAGVVVDVVVVVVDVVVVVVVLVVVVDVVVGHEGVLISNLCTPRPMAIFCHSRILGF